MKWLEKKSGQWRVVEKDRVLFTGAKAACENFIRESKHAQTG